LRMLKMQLLEIPSEFWTCDLSPEIFEINKD
jgi:hypothetical protein